MRNIPFLEGVMLRGKIGLGAIAALLVGCTSDKPVPTAFEVRAPLFVRGGNTDINLGTHLAGANEIFTPATSGGPAPADSRAQGEAIFRVNDDGTVDFRLIASNIHNVIMSHIHCGNANVNGPIRMWLFPVIGPSGAALPVGLEDQNGVLASGTFTLGTVTCPATSVGRPQGAQDMPLLEAIRAGLTYVNVHTNDGVAPTNTGPGDFPGGEIRGQLTHGGD
ncbi:MAG: CHRD domain-containing protein [Gemmatimonadaceae bacterium]